MIVGTIDQSFFPLLSGENDTLGWKVDCRYCSLTPKAQEAFLVLEVLERKVLEEPDNNGLFAQLTLARERFERVHGKVPNKSASHAHKRSRQ